MIGFYNYTVILTYISLGSSFFGISMASSGNFKAAIICLLLSGLCDMLDGPVARTKKRTDPEKKFGIQIDSLCDLVSFGVLPAYIGYCMTTTFIPDNVVYRVVALCIGVLYVLCAVIRLAFFNVMEEERQQVEGNKKRKNYQGLPVTNSALILSAIYLTKLFVHGVWYPILILGSLLVTAFLFILNFKVFKANTKQEILLGLFGLLIVIGVCLS